MSQADEMVSSRLHSRALLPQVTLSEGQRALALLYSCEQGHPAAKGTSEQPGGCFCLGKEVQGFTGGLIQGQSLEALGQALVLPAPIT